MRRRSDVACDASNHGEYVSGEAGNAGDNSQAAHSDCGKPHQEEPPTSTTTTTTTMPPAVPTYDHVVLKDNAKPDVSPIVECVVDNGDGTLTARFGYENREGFDFTLPHGKRNAVTGGPIVGEAIPVVEFHHPHLVDGRPGRTALGEGVFCTTFESYGAVVWQLAGRTATASAETPRCG